jgi:kynurenine formamidase
MVSRDDLLRVMDQDKVVVEKGDMLLLHTGFSQAILDMKREPDGEKLGSSYAVLDGRDDALLQWITDSGIASLIADNYGVEAVPSRPGGSAPHAGLPLHQHCLFKLGVNLGEMWYLTELATWLRQHKRSRFLLTAPPLRLPGAVGSPATPIATV